MLKSIKTIKFDAECYMEGTWGTRPLGKLKCSMELFDAGKGNAMIEFIAGDNVEHIGIVYDEMKKVIDYDGVFSIPDEAIKLLESVGYNLEDVA